MTFALVVLVVRRNYPHFGPIPSFKLKVTSAIADKMCYRFLRTKRRCPRPLRSFEGKWVE